MYSNVIVVINALVYITIFFLLRKKFNGFGATSFVALFYSFFAIMAIPLFVSGWYTLARTAVGEHVQEASIWPYLYMLFFLLILFVPIYRNPMEKVSVVEAPLALNEKVFAIIFVAISIITIILLAPMIPSIATSYNQASVADEFTERCFGSSRFTPLQQQFMNYGGVLRSAGIPLFFYYLSYRSKRKKMLVIFAFCVFVPSLLQAVLNLSRGAIFYWLLDILVGYVLFINFIPRDMKKIIRKIVLIAVPVLSIPAMIITFSRFGEGSDGWMSVFTYFGESFLNFPLLFWGNFTGFSHGEYFFSPVVSFFWDVHAPEGKIQRFNYFSNMTGVSILWFRTIVGSLVMEFGYWGGVLFAGIWSSFYNKLINLKSHVMPFNRMIIYYYFYMVLIQGVWGFNTRFNMIYYTLLLWFFFGYDIKNKKLKI